MNSIYDKYNLWGVKDWNLFQAAIRLNGKMIIGGQCEYSQEGGLPNNWRKEKDKPAILDINPQFGAMI